MTHASPAYVIYIFLTLLVSFSPTSSFLYYLLPFLHYHHHLHHSLFSLNILLFISFSLFFVLSQPGELYRILPFSSLSLSSRASFSFLLFRTNTLTQQKPKLLLQPAQKQGRVNNQPNKQKKKANDSLPIASIFASPTLFHTVILIEFCLILFIFGWIKSPPIPPSKFV